MKDLKMLNNFNKICYIGDCRKIDCCPSRRPNRYFRKQQTRIEEASSYCILVQQKHLQEEDEDSNREGMGQMVSK